MSLEQQNNSIGCRLSDNGGIPVLRQLATLAGCIVVSFGCVAYCSDIVEPGSLEGLLIRTESTNVVLTWPSDPRESFVVLWRSNANWQTPWTVLTNQLHASSKTNQTAFYDREFLGRVPTVVTNTSFTEFYRVFVIPDFWFDLDGVTLSGGPKNPGEDFLPFYHGSKETGIFKPHVSMLVDGKDENFGEEDIQRVNFSTEEDVQKVNFSTTTKPRWSYADGFWFKHDRIPNGEHNLQLTTLLTLNNFVGDFSQYLTLTNKPVRVWATNDITYVGWEDLIQGSNYTYAAQSVEPRANWRIDVFDTKGQLLVSKTGQIRWTWDLRDKQGKSRDDSDTDMSFPSTLTTWPIGDSSKEEQRSGKAIRDKSSLTWWSLRLGQDFVRKEPTSEERRRRFVFSEAHPLESRVPSRPWTDLQPPKKP
jgi:hypothetical protein